MRLPSSSLTERLGLHSYRGRYLWLVILLSLALAGTAYLGKYQVREQARLQAKRSQASAQLRDAAGDASRQLDALTSQLLNFSIDPAHTSAAAVRSSRQRLDTTLENLTRILSRSTLRLPSRLAQAIQADRQKLIGQVDTLINIRQSINRWVPASRKLADVMLPLNQQANTHLQNMQSMLGNTPTDLRTRLMIAELHLHWLNMVGELRLMVANRFGAFDADVQQAIAARYTNISNLVQVTNRALAALPAQLKKIDDPLLLDEYAQLNQAIHSWEKNVQNLNTLMSSDNWRRDTYYLRHQIEPVVQRLQQRIGAIRLTLRSDAQRQLDQAMTNSAILMHAIIGVAGAVVILFLLGYLAFERWLLRPIEHISRQLRTEAMGLTPAPLNLPTVTETRALVEAFDEMHEQVQARQLRLDHMAHHDALTGLPNRILFRQRLEAELTQPPGKEHRSAILFLDLDRFKQINDTHGHLVGDKLLIQVAQRLRAVLSTEDTVARLSGDEFAILMHRIDDDREPIQLARKIIKALQPAFRVQGATFHNSASIGLAVAPRDGNDADQLIQHADAAMYHAKARGPGRFSVFSPEMIEQTSAQLKLENEIHTAVEQQQLEIHLQPVIRLADGTLHACECLLRWNHPERGILLPSEFLATLENIGLLQRITDWMLDQLVHTGITEQHNISINLPAKLLHDRAFADNLEQRLRDQLHANHLIVEITEDSLSGDVMQAAHLLHRLHNQGVRIALDDFGTGQASLSHLRAFPFDLVKIDRSFIRDLEHQPDDLRLVRAMIELITTLGIKVVGEGIENRRQRELLQELGCHYGQGYLFGAAMPMQGALQAFDANPPPRLPASCERHRIIPSD